MLHTSSMAMDGGRVYIDFLQANEHLYLLDTYNIIRKYI